MSKMIEFLPDGLGRVGKRSYSFTRIEMPRGGLNFSQTKNIFYLQDFYDLLNEEGEITRWQRGGPIEPQTSTYQKIYTMGPGVDFPLIMNYTDTGNGGPYFYFLNGHGDATYFADQNFTEELIETYEYTPWGVLLTSASKNNLLLLASLYDNETNLYYLEKRYFLNILGRYTNRTNTKFLNGYFYSVSDDLEYFIWLNFNNFNKINFYQLSENYIKEKAWWPVVVIVACVILDVVNDCAAHCRDACKESGGVDTCTEYPCGICKAKCKNEKK